jgi:hypothetical protein
LILQEGDGDWQFWRAWSLYNIHNFPPSNILWSAMPPELSRWSQARLAAETPYRWSLCLTHLLHQGQAWGLELLAALLEKPLPCHCCCCR